MTISHSFDHPAPIHHHLSSGLLTFLMSLFVSLMVCSPLTTQSDPSKCVPDVVTPCHSQPPVASQCARIKMQTFFYPAHSSCSSSRASESVCFLLVWYSFFQDCSSPNSSNAWILLILSILFPPSGPHGDPLWPPY